MEGKARFAKATLVSGRRWQGDFYNASYLDRLNRLAKNRKKHGHDGHLIGGENNESEPCVHQILLVAELLCQP